MALDILIVDDERDIRELVAGVLSDEGYVCRTAADSTAALEAMLCHRTMLVAYKMAPATHWLAKRMVKTQWVSRPNLIAQESVVPELIQHAATPEAIAEQISQLLSDAETRHALEARFASMHATLQRTASERAAQAITALVAGELLEAKPDGG